jgi:valyl-tRNA synthetase
MTSFVVYTTFEARIILHFTFLILHFHTMLSNSSFWILSKFYNLEQTLNHNLINYELAHNIDAVYRFLWDDYANWYVEFLKSSPSDMEFAKELFKQFVILGSPYFPFESEVLWREFFGESQLLASFVRDQDWSYKALSVHFGVVGFDSLGSDPRYMQFENVIEFISNIRSLKGLFAIDPVTSVEIYSNSEVLNFYQDYIKLLSKATIIELGTQNYYTVKTKTYEYKIDILQYIKDKSAEIQRSNKIVESLKKQINGLQAQLDNPRFVENADPETISEKKSDLESRQIELQQQLDKIEFLGK